MYTNYISTFNIMFNSMFNILSVNEQVSQAIAQFYLKNVLKFLPSVNIYVLLIKTTSPHHGGNVRTEIIKNSGTHFFVCLIKTLDVCAHRGEETCTLYHVFQKFVRSFLRYCYTSVFVLDILCPSKGCLVHDRNVRKVFLALNLTKSSIKPFTCNNTTFTVPFLNKLLFLY